MINDYLSIAETKIPGVAKTKGLVTMLNKGGKGYIETLAPANTHPSRYEFWPYKITLYHPDMEDIVRDHLKMPDLKFKKSKYNKHNV